MPCPPKSAIGASDNWDRRHSASTREGLNEYTSYYISELKPGPVNAIFTGLLVNLQENHIIDGTPQHATKAYTLVLRDETGEITVHLWVAKNEYQLLLGHKATIWTTHICAATAVRAFTSGRCIVTTPNSTHVFPEQNPRCRLRVESTLDTAEFSLDSNMDNLMTLDQFTRHNNEKKTDGTLLVKVMAVGKPVETPSLSTEGWTTRLLVSVGDISTSNQATPILVQQPLISSFLQFVGKWLLITNCRMVQDRFIVMSKISRVMVAPKNGLAKSVESDSDTTNPWIHRMRIHGLSTDAILQELFNSSFVPRLTLSEMDALISRDPMGYHQAHVNLLISRLAFTDLWLRGMLFYSHCRVCSKTRYSNKYCNSDEVVCHPDMVNFGARVNPHLYGELSDETGGIVCSPDLSSANLPKSSCEPTRYPLLITNRAFTGLVGCHPKKLADDLMYDLEGAEACAMLQKMDDDLDWTRIEALLGWFSVQSPHLKIESSSESVSRHYHRSTPAAGSGEAGQLVLLDAKVLRGRGILQDWNGSGLLRSDHAEVEAVPRWCS